MRGRDCNDVSTSQGSLATARTQRAGKGHILPLLGSWTQFQPLCVCVCVCVCVYKLPHTPTSNSQTPAGCLRTRLNVEIESDPTGEGLSPTRPPSTSDVQLQVQVVTCASDQMAIYTYIYIYIIIFIAVQLIYNVVLVSGVQQSESVMHIHIPTLFEILFPCRSLQSIEQCSLCYTVGPYQLFILYLVVCICQSQSPNLSLPPLYPLVAISLLFTSVTLFLFCKYVHLYLIPHISDII